ncbi:hypothetical protein FB45DRAFT_947359 [Roridomyces roridus]|uniref:Uncharacterized protein n=1 Tax=Roridomyces roridus TaxID=1738132 RepID=A0AAD7F844_9AGAR|nr:hypothetical protein FB45DRAFT_947359 [Roridomyces roridus]
MPSPTETTAFVVALVALIISLLQVVQQYMATSILRSKIGPAAIGAWSKMNRRRGLDIAQFKIREEYLEPNLTWEGVERCLRKKAREDLDIVRPLKDRFAVTEYVGVGVGAQGASFSKKPTLLLRRKGDAEDAESEGVNIKSLSWADRRIVRKHSRFLREWDEPRRARCTASWSTMMAALVGNPQRLTEESSSYHDADSIQSNLDNPVMDIHFSDLISCGVALGMKIISSDLQKPELNMVGENCRIVTQERDGVGMVARYISKLGHVHNMQTCTHPEVRSLVNVAKGYIKIGDITAHMSRWGYNSIDTLFRMAVLRAGTKEDWFEIEPSEDALMMRQFSEQIHYNGDGDLRFTGKWSQPLTPRVPFILSHCAIPAVATSFPHTLLDEWPDSVRHAAVRTACSLIDRAVGFIEAPPGLYAALYDNHIMFRRYKLANNWGSEEGGMRGCIMGSLETFVANLSRCWEVDGQTEQVPLLLEFRAQIQDAQLSISSEWAKAYNAGFKTFDRDNAGNVKPTADALCWLQCMMLDSWIGRRVDLLMTNRTDEAAVPVDNVTAIKCAAKILGKDGPAGSTTGWKRCRSQFIVCYLARLADGVVREENGPRVGVSCMSPGGGIGEAGWEGMPVGSPGDWMILDAVLSLRAVLMATRFEVMHNTDVFLELSEFDPMIPMA